MMSTHDNHQTEMDFSVFKIKLNREIRHVNEARRTTVSVSCLVMSGSIYMSSIIVTSQLGESLFSKESSNH